MTGDSLTDGLLLSALAVAEHCAHWREGDGDCCICGEPNWCTDDGETPESLAVFERRRLTCVTVR